EPDGWLHVPLLAWVHPGQTRRSRGAGPQHPRHPAQHHREGGSVSQEKVRLVISIAGPVRSGKTSIAALVSRLLEQAGIAVTTSDPDLDSGRVPPDLDRCLAALAGKVEAEVVTVSTLKPGDGPLSA